MSAWAETAGPSPHRNDYPCRRPVCSTIQTNNDPARRAPPARCKASERIEIFEHLPALLGAQVVAVVVTAVTIAGQGGIVDLIPLRRSGCGILARLQHLVTPAYLLRVTRRTHRMAPVTGASGCRARPRGSAPSRYVGRVLPTRSRPDATQWIRTRQPSQHFLSPAGQRAPPRSSRTGDDNYATVPPGTARESGVMFAK